MSPDAYTIAVHMLPVGQKHTLYVHDWGNRKAKIPIVFLHGGPGSHCRDKHKLPFDPVHQRVIFHDQRGCGKSTPLGLLRHNNTQELAADITKIADFLKLNRFILTGDSWGSCLALYYALCEPRRVDALVVGGVLTGSQAEIDWIDQGMFQTHFPDVWDRYLTATPQKFRDNPSAYHFSRILGSDAAAAAESALAYTELESGVVSLDDSYLPISPNDFDPIGIINEVYYLSNGFFLADRFILKNASKLHMPIHMVQGRYDFVCPPRTAYEITKSAQNAHINWVLAGHKDEHESTTAKRLIFNHLTREK